MTTAGFIHARHKVSLQSQRSAAGKETNRLLEAPEFRFLAFPGVADSIQAKFRRRSEGGKDSKWRLI